MSRPPKVLVAMSGGVDSSVAACLLQEQGYDVIGVFMRLGAEKAIEADSEAQACRTDGPRSVSLPLASGEKEPGAKHAKGCCSAADATDARSVAGRLGIPFYALNFERDFNRLIDYFADEYAQARTPNPCVMCNQWLKFGKLAGYANVVDADFIATGHYARVDHEGPRSRLLQARYLAKDQSYVLFGISPTILRRTLFPLGDMTKAEVREHARRFGLELHDKPESQDICFVPDGDYGRIVKSRRPEAFIPGQIQHTDGRILGEHEGLPNFTIGQRRGLRVAVGSPIYVSELDRSTGTVTVGPRESALSNTAQASRVSWLRERPEEPIRAHVKIRYQHEPAVAEVIPLPDHCVRVVFDEAQLAVTPGQAAVFYDGDEVLGGGWIDGR